MSATPTPTEPRYRAVFVSDLHLGAAGAKPKAASQFFESLACDSLYLVGDIFDGYVGRKACRGHVGEIMRPMMNCAEELFYTPGNHDSFLRKLNGTHYGHLQFAEFFIHTTGQGKKFLVIHGDQFDKSCKEGWMIAYAGAWAYEFLTRANQSLNRGRERKGHPPLTFAAKAKHAVKGAVKKGTTYETELLELAQKHGCEGVICGHVHRPEIRNVGNLLYVNTGDWVENQSLVVENQDGTIELISPYQNT